MADISSSQESLPLSQGTLETLWQTIPQVIRDINSVNNGFSSDIFSSNIFEEANNNKSVEIETEFMEESAVETVPPAPQIALPIMEDYPGTLNFSVSVPPSEKLKSSLYIFSDDAKKLYVRKDAVCPFNFSVNRRVKNCSIRAILYFTSPENSQDVVVRCISHSLLDRDNGDPYFEHLVHCESRCSSYFKDIVTNRFSVTVPFENPSDGELYSTYLYKFTCFTSCPGGPNRRAFSVVFTLENGNSVLGRRKIDLKICSSPYRDKLGDEKILAKKKDLNHLIQKSVPGVNIPKKRKSEDSTEGVYIIEVKDKDCYNLLMGVKKYFYMKKLANGGPDWVPTNPAEISVLMKMLTSSSEDEKENSA